MSFATLFPRFVRGPRFGSWQTGGGRRSLLWSPFPCQVLPSSAFKPRLHPTLDCLWSTSATKATFSSLKARPSSGRSGFPMPTMSACASGTNPWTSARSGWHVPCQLDGKQQCLVLGHPCWNRSHWRLIAPPHQGRQGRQALDSHHRGCGQHGAKKTLLHRRCTRRLRLQPTQLCVVFCGAGSEVYGQRPALRRRRICQRGAEPGTRRFACSQWTPSDILSYVEHGRLEPARRRCLGVLV